MKKILNKICVLVLTLALIFTSIPVVSAATPVKVTVGNVTAERGKDFEITVSLENVPVEGIAVLGFGIQFDTDYITINSIDEGPVSKTGAWEKEKTYEPEMFNVFQTAVADDIIRVEWMSGLPLSDKVYYIHNDGVLCTIKGNFSINAPDSVKTLDFKVVPGKTGGSVIFGYFANDSDDSSFVSFGHTAVNGMLTVKGNQAQTDEKPANWPDVIGDLDGDSAVKVADIIILLKFIGGTVGPSVQDSGGKPTWHMGMQDCADAFREKTTPYVAKINAQDLVAILQFVLGSVKSLPQVK